MLLASGLTGTGVLRAHGSIRSTCRSAANFVRSWAMWVQGWALVLAFVASLDILIGLWPAVEAATSSSGSAATSATATPVRVHLLFGLLSWKPSTSVALLGLVAVAGVLGSLVHTMDSFALHVADGDFDKAWNWWYLIRPFVGAGLAVLTYLLVRGQLLGLNGSSTALNPYGIAGVAALAGLFSKQAVSKLAEVFDTLFAPTTKSNPPTMPSTAPSCTPSHGASTSTSSDGQCRCSSDSGTSPLGPGTAWRRPAG